jgi:hypothetical protein
VRDPSVASGHRDRLGSQRTNLGTVSNDPDSLPTLEDPTGPCPRCRRVSNFYHWHTQPLVSTGGGELDDERVVVLGCMGCGRGTAVVERQVIEESTGTAIWAGLHWWPVPGAGILDSEVPEAVASAYDEGTRCLAVRADRASVVMFRAALAEIVTNKGSAAAKGSRGLTAQLRQMADDGDLYPSLVDWADEIRSLGDVGAHPNELGDVDHDDAVNLSHLTRRMIDVLYEVPARVNRSRQSRTAGP